MTTPFSAAERRYLEEEAHSTKNDIFTRRAARELLSESTLASPSTAAITKLTPAAKRATHFGRVRISVCALSACISAVVAFQAGSAPWASEARNSLVIFSRGLGFFGSRNYARPVGHSLGGGGGPPLRERSRKIGAANGPAPAPAPDSTSAYAPPAFLASLLPKGAGAPDDAPGSHPWLTHQECWTSADESEGCLYTGPFCTDGDVVYVSAREGQAAWPAEPENKHRAANWPPSATHFANAACWDTRSLEATTGCGYGEMMDRTAPTDGGGAADGGGAFWATPLESRADRGFWGPASSLTPIVPLHWTVFANALHAGPHHLADPSAHLVKLRKEWESPIEGGEDVEKNLAAEAAIACGDATVAKIKAAKAPGARGKPILELHWLDGAIYATTMAVGWLGHPWHFSTAAFPFWTAKRRNATALHVARTAKAGSGGGASVLSLHTDLAGESADNDDGSATREMVLTSGGPLSLPPMSYATFLIGQKFDGLEEDGTMKGLLGDETPGRRGRGIGDMGSWQRGVWPLLTQSSDAEGLGGTTLVTRRTMGLALGVGPTEPNSPPTHIGQSPRSLYDARLVCAADAQPVAEAKEAYTKSFADEAECLKKEGQGTTGVDCFRARPLPRLMCSAHGGVLFGLQPKLFAGAADANAFRVAAWARAGVLLARADAAKADALRDKVAKERGLEAAAAVNRARLGIETRANSFLRGKKKKWGAGDKDGSGSGSGERLERVRWWDAYPPRAITVVTRSGTRFLQPKRPLRALLKHVGLPVRWMGGLGSRTWDEQVAVMSGTGIFIGAHGGDFAGIPFLPPSAAVIEAFPYMMDHEGYRHLAEVTGARYTRLAAPVPTYPTTILGPPHPDWPTDKEAPLSIPSDKEERAEAFRTSAFESLFTKPDFERFCEDPQRVSSLDGALLSACNGRSKNSAVELDWPPLVTALVNALDDIGCRPRQFSAAASRAIRKAQKEAGLHEALWENWGALADADPRKAEDPLGLPPASGDGKGDAFDRGGLVGDILRALGLEDVDMGEVDGREELWGGEAGVFENFDVMAGKQHNVTAMHLLPGVPISYLRLEEIHLVPVTGGDGYEGAQMPYINVRAKCAPRDRSFRDKSPW